MNMSKPSEANFIPGGRNIKYYPRKDDPNFIQKIAQKKEFSRGSVIIKRVPLLMNLMIR